MVALVALEKEKYYVPMRDVGDNTCANRNSVLVWTSRCIKIVWKKRYDNSIQYGILKNNEKIIFINHNKRKSYKKLRL